MADSSSGQDFDGENICDILKHGTVIECSDEILSPDPETAENGGIEDSNDDGNIDFEDFQVSLHFLGVIA